MDAAHPACGVHYALSCPVLLCPPLLSRADYSTYMNCAAVSVAKVVCVPELPTPTIFNQVVCASYIAVHQATLTWIACRK